MRSKEGNNCCFVSLPSTRLPAYIEVIIVMKKETQDLVLRKNTYT